MVLEYKYFYLFYEENGSFYPVRGGADTKKDYLCRVRMLWFSIIGGMYNDCKEKN